jgi:hypothetical protein
VRARCCRRLSTAFASAGSACRCCALLSVRAADVDVARCCCSAAAAAAASSSPTARAVVVEILLRQRMSVCALVCIAQRAEPAALGEVLLEKGQQTEQVEARSGRELTVRLQPSALPSRSVYLEFLLENDSELLALFCFL